MKRLAALVLLLICAPCADADPPDWRPAGTYSNTLNVVAIVLFDGIEADYPHDLMAAFVGGESRGLAAPVKLKGAGGYMFFLTIGSNAARDGEAITFKAYDASTDTERTLCETITFRSGTTRGTPGDPFALHAADFDICPLYWTSPPGFSQYMVVNAALFFDSMPATPQDRVVALVNGEVRGVGDAVTDPNGKQYYQIVVWGDVAGEEVTFQTYDYDRQLIYAPKASVFFAANTVAATASSPLLLNGSDPLPVELIAFTATQNGSAVRLEWKTASETNNAGFEVQVRAQDERPDEASSPAEWHFLTFVEGHGTTMESRRYSHRIARLLPGRHQFRLKQLDFDGTFSYSPVVEVAMPIAAAFSLSAASPNPFRGKTQLVLTVAQSQRVRVAVYDLPGRVVECLYDGIVEGQANLPILFEGEALPSGTYVLSVEGERFRTSQMVTRLQ